MASYMGDAMGILKKVTTTVKQVALNLTETEIKVEEATNNEPWGPHGTTMSGVCLEVLWVSWHALLTGMVGCNLTVCAHPMWDCRDR